MVGVTGFEPATPTSRRCSRRVSWGIEVNHGEPEVQLIAGKIGISGFALSTVIHARIFKVHLHSTYGAPDAPVDKEAD
jgi:hypothetical protein